MYKRRGYYLVMWKIEFTKQAKKDLEKLKSSGLSTNAKILFDTIKNNPYQTPPSYEKLLGKLSSVYSRRINRQHRLIYQIFPQLKTIKIIRMWTHYE